MMKQIYRLNWERFMMHAKCLIEDIKNVKTPVTLIVGILRGGAVPASVLSNATGIPMKTFQWSTGEYSEERKDDIEELHRIVASNFLSTGGYTLILDEIIDSGETLEQLTQALTELGCTEWYTGAIVYNIRAKHSPNFYSFVIDRYSDYAGYWIHFPWEPDPNAATP